MPCCCLFVSFSVLFLFSSSRKVIAKALILQFEQLMSTGWVLTKEDVERDVERLLGGAYIEFMEKDLRVAKE